jgi:hypothetical protein
MERFYGPQSAIGQSEGQASTNAPLKIMISGNLRNPGLYAWTNGMTLSNAIDMAGGFTDFAPRTLYLQHWDCSTEKFRLGRGNTLKSNPTLKSGDSVISPMQHCEHLGDIGMPARSFMPEKTSQSYGLPHFN